MQLAMPIRMNQLVTKGALVFAQAFSFACAACSAPVSDDARAESTEALGLQCRDAQGEPGCFLTTSTDASTFPSISGTRVVWSTRHTNGRSGVELVDLSVSTTATEITPTNTSNVLERVDGNRVIYTRVPPYPQPWQFIGRNLLTGEETTYGLLSADFGVPFHSVQGERVVFPYFQNGTWDIHMFDFTTNTLRRISTSSAEEGDPVIFGHRIAWIDRRNGQTWYDLYVYDLTTNTEQRISQQSTVGRSPVLAADRVIWGDLRGGAFTLYQYVFDGPPPKERPIPTKTKLENFLTLSGSVLAWVNRNDDNPVFYDDVFVYDLETGVERQITHGTARQWGPAVSGPLLVWDDNRRGNSDIVVERLDKLWF